ncbi:MAG TPA: hypothetical protein VFI28_11240 [Candidatus Limnocylindrales bacterium]|nr:hypothetical protein [Candidatus Limnocylindrales bacterium]
MTTRSIDPQRRLEDRLRIELGRPVPPATLVPNVRAAIRSTGQATAHRLPTRPLLLAAAVLVGAAALAVGSARLRSVDPPPTPVASPPLSTSSPRASVSPLTVADLRAGATLLAIGYIAMRDGDERLLAWKGERLYVIAGPSAGAGGDVEVQWFGSLDHGYTPTGRTAAVPMSELLPRAVPYTPDCPTEPVDPGALGRLLPFERLVCFGARTITLSPVMLRPAPDDHVAAWRLTGDGSADPIASVAAIAPPGTSAPEGRWLEVSGSFDSAPSDCRGSDNDVILRCRELFVVVSSREIPAPVFALDAQWGQIPDAPIRGAFAQAIAWTGSEMLTWGGVPSSNGAARVDVPENGAAYDPTTRSWRTLPAAPIGPRFDTVSAWTGHELLVWGGSWPWGDPKPLADGAAFDPATNRWRRIPHTPIKPSFGSVGTWTGSELVVAALPGPRGGEAEVAAFNRATNRWRTLPDLPLRGGFAELVAVGDRIVAIDRSDGELVGIRTLAPDDDAWHDVDTSNVPPSSPLGVVSTGEELLVLGELPSTTGGPTVSVVRRYDPLAGTWRIGAPSPAWDSSSGLWTGSLVLYGSLAYDPGADRWLAIAPDDADEGLHGGKAVWAGDRLIQWSGLEGESVVAPRGGVELVLLP